MPSILSDAVEIQWCARNVDVCEDVMNLVEWGPKVRPQSEEENGVGVSFPRSHGVLLSLSKAESGLQGTVSALMGVLVLTCAEMGWNTAHVEKLR